MHPSDIVFYGASAFLVGVLTASAGWNFLLVFILAVALGAAVFILSPREVGGFVLKKVRPLLLIVFLICFFAGAFYYNLYLNLRETRENIHFGDEISFYGVVITEPKFSEKTQFFDVELQPPFAGKVRIVTSQVPERRYGDLLAFRGSIERPERRIDSPVSVFPKVEYKESGRGFWFKANLLNLKSSFINQFRRVLPADSAALLSGITFGYQSDFTRDFKDKMSASGTTHLVALSGYNIAILVLVIAALLNYFLSRRLTFYLTVVVILLFVVMVGAEPSVVRAAIMGFLILLAKEVGRVYSFRNAITLAAFVMVLFDPTILVWNLGFQLSFLSLLGIVYLLPAIKKFLKLKEEGSVLGWRENALTTLSAQLAVAPMLILNFNQFSPTSLLANVLILEFVPLTMALGFSLAFIGTVFSALGSVLAWFINLLLVYEIGVINLFATFQLPLGGWLNSLAVFALYYAALLGFIIYSTKPKLFYGTAR